MDHGDLDTLRKEGEAFTQSVRGQAVTERARMIVQREEHQHAQREAQQPPRDPRDARHPDHTLNDSIRTQLETLHTRNGIFPTHKMLDHLTAGIALNARKQGLTRVDALHFNTDRTRIIAEQNAANVVLGNHSATNIQHAMQTSPDQSYQQMAQETQQQAHLQQHLQQQAMQQRSQQGPSLGR